MAYAQQITQEQEAQNENNNLVEINLSLEAKVILAYKHQTANRDKLLKKLARANAKKSKQKYKKTFVLCKQAVELADTVLKKIFSGKRVLLNHKYISKITECDSRKQNVRILEQLENLLGIEYHRLAIVDGTPYNYHYSFKLNPTVVEELKDAGAWEGETIGTFLSQPYNNRPYTSSGSKIDHRANPSSNSNLNSTNKTSSSDTKKEQVELPNKTEAIVKQLQVKPPRPANARQKATKAQRKARIYQLPQQFDKPKLLAEMEPITEKESAILQSKSGREFTFNAQNQILQDMSKRLTRTFNSRWQFICYFSDCLRYEKRDAVQCSGNNFYIKANVTEEDVLYNQREKYFTSVEETAIRQVSPNNQFRAKLVGTVECFTAYDLLLAMQSVSEIGNTLVMSLNKDVELTEGQKQVVLAQAQAVFNIGGLQGEGKTIERIEFVVKTSSYQKPVSKTLPTNSNIKPEGDLPKGKWDKIAKNFIAEYGENLYKHWLANLEIKEKADCKTIQLKTTSNMVRDRIEQTYLRFLSKVAAKFGINKVEFVV